MPTKNQKIALEAKCVICKYRRILTETELEKARSLGCATCDKCGNPAIISKASIKTVTKKEPKLSRKQIREIAEFSYTKSVLAFDDVVDWLEERLALKDAPTPPRGLIKFLKRMRQEASQATSSKPFHWD